MILTRLLAVAVLLLLPPPLLLAQTPTADSHQWAAVPTILPPGARIALVSGDPAGPGPSTVVIAMPDGYRMPPHFHPTAEHVEVVSGALLVGVGDRLDPRRTQLVSVGDTGTAPPGAHHYSIARGPTVVWVSFAGPYTISYVHDYQAPRRSSFPYQF